MYHPFEAEGNIKPVPHLSVCCLLVGGGDLTCSLKVGWPGANGDEPELSDVTDGANRFAGMTKRRNRGGQRGPSCTGRLGKKLGRGGGMEEKGWRWSGKKK